MGFFDFFSNLFGGHSAPTRPTKPIIVLPPAPQQIPVKQLLDLDKVNYVESPNKSDRSDIIRGIVLHHTGPGTFNGIIKWLTDPAAKVSAHYVVGMAGELTQLVNTSHKAWHCAPSQAMIDGQMRNNLNSCTIGIEICNIGLMQKGDDGKFYYDEGSNKIEWKGQTPELAMITYPSGKTMSGYFVPYPKVQVDKVVELCKALVAKYPQIKREDMTTHFWIALPEGNKNDPFGLDVEYIKKEVFG